MQIKACFLLLIALWSAGNLAGEEQLPFSGSSQFSLAGDVFICNSVEEKKEGLHSFLESKLELYRLDEKGESLPSVLIDSIGAKENEGWWKTDFSFQFPPVVHPRGDIVAYVYHRRIPLPSVWKDLSVPVNRINLKSEAKAREIRGKDRGILELRFADLKQGGAISKPVELKYKLNKEAFAPGAFAFSPDGKKFGFAVEEDYLKSVVYLIDMDTGASKKIKIGKEGRVTALMPVPEREMLLLALGKEKDWRTIETKLTFWIWQKTR